MIQHDLKSKVIIMTRKSFILEIRYILIVICILFITCATKENNTQPVYGFDGEMALIPEGEFIMGKNGSDDNSPEHKVRISSFYMDIHEVTNAEYSNFCSETERKLPEFWGMEEFHSGPDFPDHPVVGITWEDASKYAEWCDKRLPTEAEWEYAARGGLEGADFPNGNKINSDVVNYLSKGTVKVSSYVRNGYGLFDMAGNVNEWTMDFYDKDYYKVSPEDNPKGPKEGKYKVIRGGGWHSGPTCNRVHSRICLRPYWVDFNLGFRCVKDVN